MCKTHKNKRRYHVSRCYPFILQQTQRTYRCIVYVMLLDSVTLAYLLFNSIFHIICMHCSFKFLRKATASLASMAMAPWQRPDFSQQYCLLSAVPADHSSALQEWQVCQCGRRRPSSSAADSFIRVVIKTRRADAQPHSSC